MTREEKVLSQINRRDIGLEIGPSFSPFASKKDGFNVEIIDHLSKEELMKKYAEHRVDLSKIEEVDFIWDGRPYAEITGRKKYYNWIIASHLIEHTPDIIAFLNQCDDVLREDGVLSLVIPDNRYCFDFFRPITGIGKILDAYYNKNIIHTPGTAVEYFLNFVKKGGNICWGEDFPGELDLEFSKEDAYAKMQAILQNNTYLDLHAWCFTPTSFRLIIQDLNDLGLISLKEVSFFPTYSCEFYITLGRKGSGFHQNRLDALKTIKAELSF
jgi:predicted SAM-dependent methyltransferase